MQPQSKEALKREKVGERPTSSTPADIFFLCHRNVQNVGSSEKVLAKYLECYPKQKDLLGVEKKRSRETDITRDLERLEFCSSNQICEGKGVTLNIWGEDVRTKSTTWIQMDKTNLFEASSVHSQMPFTFIHGQQKVKPHIPNPTPLSSTLLRQH